MKIGIAGKVGGFLNDVRDTVFKDIDLVGKELIRKPESIYSMTMMPVDISNKEDVSKEVFVFTTQPQNTIRTGMSANIAIFNMPNGMPQIQHIGSNAQGMSWKGLFYDKTGAVPDQLEQAKKVAAYQEDRKSVV